jgi:hypothetical protein
MRSVSYHLRVRCDAEEKEFELSVQNEAGVAYQHLSAPNSSPAKKALSKRLFLALAAAWPSEEIEFNGVDNRITSVQSP